MVVASPLSKEAEVRDESIAHWCVCVGPRLKAGRLCCGAGLCLVLRALNDQLRWPRLSVSALSRLRVGMHPSVD